MNQQIQQAIADINIIRRLIESPRPNTESPSAKTAKIMVLSLALLISVLAIIFESANAARFDSLLKFTKGDGELTFGSIFYMGYTLMVVLAALYFVLWRGAQRDEENLNSYISKNFTYVKNLSLVSDLFLKFTTIAVVIVLGAPQFISALLLLFTGDYLLQGRLFVLPIRVTIALGVACIIGAGILCYLNESTFLIPLWVFASLAAASIAYLLNAKKA